jgi:hypothetical protein
MLINLRTDLKSLRYGNDTIGGGNSGQPYIQKAIPDSFNGLGASEDFILRGGINAITDSLTDVARLAKMFTDTKSPNGLLFIAKQQLLSRTAVRTQTSGILNEDVYSPLNTLAQAGVVAFGGHLNKQGINPFAQTGVDANNNALYNTRVKSNQLPAQNRLVQLYSAGNNNTSEPFGNGIRLNTGPINGSKVNVMTYTGGPGSDLGIGRTNIKYSPLSQTFITKDPNIYNFSPLNSSLNNWVFSSKQIRSPYSLTSESLRLQLGLPEDFQGSQLKSGETASPPIQDFRAIIRSKLKGQDKDKATQSGATSLSLSYNIADNKTIEGRVNLGDPGARADKSYASYENGVIKISTNKSPYPNFSIPKIGTTDAPSGLDRITSIPIYRSTEVTTNSTVNDLVKFRIAVIDNNSPNFKTFIHFRAFIDSMSDSYSATWSGFNYLGRSEQFYNYGGYTRNVSLSWTVAAQSKQELIPMYKKLNYLASSLTGDYSPNGYMRGNLVQLTIGGYLYEQPGIITSLTYDVPTESPWEIGIGTGFNASGDTIQGDSSVKELPHIIRVTGFNFIPIQNFVPQKQQLTFASINELGAINNDVGFVETEGFERYIALANGDDKSKIFTNYNNPSTGSAT